MNVGPIEIARRTLGRMTLAQRVGQVFMLGLEGTRLDASHREVVHDLHLGGVTLFARNIRSGPQLRGLTAQLQSLADAAPLFISADQEGGLVVRVTTGATIFAGNMALGAAGDLQLARQVAEATATELRAMGVNMDLAPVLDVNTNPLNPVIGVRSFGSSADLVSNFGVQTIQALQSGGVSAIAKHFPGHGDTHVDSHSDLPVMLHGLERLHVVELAPFRAAISAGVDGIMTAHVCVASIDPRQGMPATLSTPVLTGLLRDRLGYRGLILTDALDMQAIRNAHTPSDAAVLAFEAGADMLLIAGIDAHAREQAVCAPFALLAAVKAGRISEARLDASVLRILETKALRGILTPSGTTGPRRWQPDPTTLNCPDHRALALEVARRAVTLQRDTPGILPLRVEQRVLVVVAEAPTRSDVQDDEDASHLLGAIRRFAPSARGASPLAAVSAAVNADVVVLGTFDLPRDSAQQALAQSLAATGKPVVGVSLRGPYDAPAAPEVRTWLTVYGDRAIHVQAAAEVLFGHLNPAGRVP